MRFLLYFASLLLVTGAASAQILATVDGASLTWDDVLQMIGGEENIPYLGITSEAGAVEVLRSWVMEEILVQAAENTGLDSDPEVAAAIEVARRQILLEVYISEIVSDIRPSQLEIENYVDEWLETYRKSVHARHIIVTDENLANSLHARLIAGSDFPTLAEEYSIGPSGADGGDLGWMTRAQSGYMSFDEAAFRLDEGEISDVVETGAGFHIVKVIEVQLLSPVPTDEEIQQVVAIELTQVMQEEAMLARVDELEVTYTIEIFPERLLEHLE